ncbi:hypothetical protein [Novosphingobium terrae]|uniref:hypothetical protein n=1 Tax=Novosphingobium terrae TaxID=2726189 RepID=UPI00197E57E5|nr:hypothetical protein [Novosphingobium terrae]
MSQRINQLLQRPDEDLIERLTLLIESAVSALDEGQECAHDIAEINRLSGGRHYNRHTFFELYRHTSARTFAEIAAKGRPPLLENLDRDELIEILDAIKDPDLYPEYFIEILDLSLPKVWSSDLIFWPTKERSSSELADYLISQDQKEV